MGFFSWGEPTKQDTTKTPGHGRRYATPDYDKAKKRWIDPRKVKWADTPVDEAWVRRYMQNPNLTRSVWEGGDGDPFVVVNKHGVAEGWNGKHRATAAMRQGRKLRVRYFDVRDQ
ncbi:hypothetical protein [Pseudonocardia spinosispora]|uniref:hypothetical protein n=1 Tax=Pseudonocardia spinosispora TaxID=103441 RepID=UPI000406EBDC|nr:hypothetical protein [Pseudonocardia spinosispora]